MSYAIYKTEALIIRVTPNGEASLDVTFLTKEFGKITARAQSARKSESKMRMHLTRYNYVVIDVVRGKSIWRLTGVSTLERMRVFESSGFLHAWHRMISLAEYLIRGEEAHPELFNFFIKLGEWISVNKNTSPEGLELFGVIHVLDMLGYWHGERLLEAPSLELLGQLVVQKKELVKMINESIEATQIMV